MVAILPVVGKAIVACGHPVIATETKEMETTLYIKHGKLFIHIYKRQNIIYSMLNFMLV